MEKKHNRPKKQKINVRNATTKDISSILDLTARAYPNMPHYREAHLRGQIANFAEGQFVVEFEDKIVGYCATFQIKGEEALKPHTWSFITGQGFASRHNPRGDYLYGFEVCVDPAIRGYRIGKRLYDARKALCEAKHLKGIIIVGRMPSLKRNLKKCGSAENYIELVLSKKIRDKVMLFQTRAGFEIVQPIAKYLPSDHESMGYGLMMKWENLQYRPSPEKERKLRDEYTIENVRIAIVQYKQRKVDSFEQFIQFVRYFVDVAAAYEADFVLFPEWFTMQLLSIDNSPIQPSEAIRQLAKYTPDFEASMRDMAMKFNINIIGGSTATLTENDEVRNTAFVFLRDGQVFTQDKIHPTPNEVYWWGLTGGSKLSTIETDCGPIGVQVCYDSEFPESSRYLTDQGMKILFVPFCTDERKSYLRVRYCGQARAVENQIYVAMAGNVGNLPSVENMDIQYAQSCILTPCDFPFARDGIAADTTPNIETVAFADVRIDDLTRSRHSGTVQNLRDRRHDLYQVKWHSD